ncbi:hypothetical protein KAFR_0A02080 [Kazachstania africana CBS 2517]|uniref:Clu domain-containing protein n=1 Tax=Kazachstania africana (strain ATCC 22294 / BCRC 22015 / CBS 2517 / CECT 1963 / NBRC 1671 / NRRL Y-8276) TaxID=1071382 RepID=H2AMP6_KAZAF|nr:hypothetical protein KAFR_0A02080 [Kazachstania africana CBS 2517]CCF55646.1 hypothetical protein KAFR_0A02080 [Kazachstania africana CBS 2517]
MSENNVHTKVSIKIPQVDGSVGSKKSAAFETLSFQFNKDAKVQTILDVLAVANESKYLTNIELTQNGDVLRDDQLINELVMNKKGDAMEVTANLRPYTTREVLKHTLAVREFTGFTSETEDGLSEFALSTVVKFPFLSLDEIKEKKTEINEEKAKETEAKKHLLNVTDEERDKTVKMIHEVFNSFKNSSVKELFNGEKNLISPCLRSLNISQYNPAPAFYKSKGHLLYLHAVTLEGESVHITAVPSGFYINKSTNIKFDPYPRESEDGAHSNAPIFNSLMSLLSAHSKKFSSHVAQLEAKLAKLESVAYVRPQTCHLHKPWIISSNQAQNADFSRLQNKLIGNAINPERNFNDEFQAIKDFPNATISTRIESERILAKIIHEFSVSATNGAMDIFYKNFIAMNPEASEKEQIFLKNNIFYSFVSDVSGVYESKGGDEAARVAANQDLLTINVLNRVGLKDVRHVLTTIIDFGGKRLLAQTPVPGLLGNMGVETTQSEKAGEEIVKDLDNDVNVKYGFDETCKKVLKDEAFDDILSKEFSKVFHLKKADDNDVWFSSSSKGIIGFDKRKYVLDLADTYPIDINFARENYDSKSDDDNRYPHRHTLLRPELVEKWWTEKVEAEEGLTTNDAYDQRKFTYNPDAYHIEGVEDNTVEELSSYLNDEVIPNLVNDFALGNLSPPYTGSHLKDILHKSGINLRYLGKIVKLANDKLTGQIMKHEQKLNDVVVKNREHDAWEAAYLLKIESLIKERQAKINQYIQEGKDVPKELTEDLKLDESEIKKPTNEEPVLVSRDELLPFIKIAEIEIVSRSIKHILRSYAKSLPVSAVPSLVAYVFNLLFGTKYCDTPRPESIDHLFSVESFQFSTLTRMDLLNAISKEASVRFCHELSVSSIEQCTESPFILIKEIANKFGVQLLNKNYFFTVEEFEDYKLSQDKKVRNKLVAPTYTFSKEDIIIRPLVKSSSFSSITSEDFWTQGTSLLGEEGKQSEAITLMAQSLAILEDVKGIVHTDVAERYLRLATVYSKINLIPEAIAFCRKACTIYERTCGIDSFEMLRALNNLALLELTNESPYNATLIYNKIIEVMSVFNLPKFHHPSASNVYNNLEQISLGIDNVKLTIDVLNQLGAFIAELDGDKNIAYGYNESRLGNLYATVKDYRSAIQHIAKAENIFTTELGSNHTMTQTAKQWSNGLGNLIKEMHQKKQLQQDQMSAGKTVAAQSSNTSGQRRKSHSSKKEAVPNPELAGKSVDELLTFIEGDEKKSKSSKGKKKNSKK